VTDKSKRRKKPDFEDFRQWLTGLEMTNPTLHVNGSAYTTAVMTVDFGTPLVEQKLSPEQSAELVARMRAATKSLYPGDPNVQVQSDAANGVWWTAVAS